MPRHIFGPRARSATACLLLLGGAALAPALGDLAAASVPVPAAERLRFDRVALATGVSLHVAEQGRAGGRTMIFLHGYSDSWASWSRILPLLPDSIRALAIDQRGHGASDKPATGYAMRDLAADVVALMDARGIRRATIVGHSMGTMVAQQVAVLAPDRVDGLVLMNGGRSLRRFINVEGLGPALAGFERESGPEAPAPESFAREFQYSTVHHEVPAAFMDSAIAASGKLPLRVWRALLEGMASVPEATTLARHRIPALLMFGTEDQIATRAEQDSLRAMLPGATLRTYSATGHAPQWERPANVAEDLLRWMAARR